MPDWFKPGVSQLPSTRPAPPTAGQLPARPGSGEGGGRPGVKPPATEPPVATQPIQVALAQSHRLPHNPLLQDAPA
jgi:hypothetical protein